MHRRGTASGQHCPTPHPTPYINKYFLDPPLSYVYQLTLYCSVYISLVDIDECVVNVDECNPNAVCSDNIGSYDCSCNSGFEGDGFFCESEFFFFLSLKA